MHAAATSIPSAVFCKLQPKTCRIAGVRAQARAQRKCCHPVPSHRCTALARSVVVPTCRWCRRGRGVGWAGRRCRRPSSTPWSSRPTPCSFCGSSAAKPTILLNTGTGSALLAGVQLLNEGFTAHRGYALHSSHAAYWSGAFFWSQHGHRSSLCIRRSETALSIHSSSFHYHYIVRDTLARSGVLLNLRSRHSP